MSKCAGARACHLPAYNMRCFGNYLVKVVREIFFFLLCAEGNIFLGAEENRLFFFSCFGHFSNILI